MSLFIIFFSLEKGPDGKLVVGAAVAISASAAVCYGLFVILMDVADYLSLGCSFFDHFLGKKRSDGSSSSSSSSSDQDVHVSLVSSFIFHSPTKVKLLCNNMCIWVFYNMINNFILI